MIVLACLAAMAATALCITDSHWRRLRPVARRSRPTLVQVVTVVTPLAGFALFGAVGLIVGAVAIPAVRRGVSALEHGAQRRRTDELAAHLPFVLEVTAALVGSGRAPGDAVAIIAGASEPPIQLELRRLTARLDVSIDQASVWSELRDDPVVGVLARAFHRSEVSGMPVATLVEQAALDQRRRTHAALRERAGRVGVRCSLPLGLCFLPAFFAIGVVPTLIAVVSGLDLGF